MTHPLFSFIHVTDMHLREELDVVTPFIEAVNAERYHRRPDFIVFGGDNVDGDRHDGTVCKQQMPMLKERLGKLRVPHCVICHNHDTWAEEERGSAFRHHITEKTEFSFELPGGFAAIAISGCIMDGDQWIEGIISRPAWLDEQLAKMTDKKVLLFSHMPMLPPRQPVPDPRRPQMKDDRWEAHLYGYAPERSKGTRDVIAKHGKVIAHYSGHCHVNSVTESEGTHYITTAALSTQPWEYRYVEVYPDRIEHTCVRPHSLNTGKHPSEDSSISSSEHTAASGVKRKSDEVTGRHFWTNCIDGEHPDVDLYHDGLPHERDFVIDFSVYTERE